jgi:hypothetical protein
MNLPKIVCPHNKKLLRSLTGCTLAVRVNNINTITTAAADVRESGNNLFCVIFEAKCPLDGIEFREDLKGIPLAIMATSLRKFRNLARHLKILRELNLRVYLPCDKPKNIVGLRILSSVGIHSCAVFGDGNQDWEALSDLMTYAVLERTPHAAIEPFTFIASHYDPSSYLEWGSFYFNDPKHFLHLDAEGRVALSYAELIKKRFVAESISEIVAADEFPAIEERIEAWRQYFVDDHPCASCGGWKICLGRFSVGMTENKGCEAFFLETMEVARQYKVLKDQFKVDEIWQP